MDRRDLLKTVALLSGGLATSPLASAIAAAFEGQAPTASNPPLAVDEVVLAGVLAEHIIPVTDTPGALAAGVERYIASMVADYLPESESVAYREGLAAFNALAEALHGAPFVDQSPDAQVSLLRELDRQTFEPSGNASDAEFAPELTTFWRTQKALTVAGYFTSEVGATQALPPAYMGPFEADIPYPPPGSAPH